MKKIFLLLVASLMIAPNAIAQSKFHLGVNGSYNVPVWNWSFSPVDFTTSNSGATIGVFGDYTINNSGALRAGLNCSFYEFALSKKTGLNVSYLEIPITYRLNIVKNTGLMIYAGIGAGFALNKNPFWSMNDPELSNLPILHDFKDEYLKDIRVYIPIGIAYDFKFGLSIDVGYSSNINNIKGNTGNGDFVQGLDSFHFGLAYTFGAGK